MNEWMQAGMVVGLFIAGVALATWLSTYIPNGDAICCSLKMKRGWYWVRTFDPANPGEKFGQNCASLQDEKRMYRPFYVFLPEHFEGHLERGDRVRLVWKNKRWDLDILRLEDSRLEMA